MLPWYYAAEMSTNRLVTHFGSIGEYNERLGFVLAATFVTKTYMVYVRGLP